MNTMRAKVAVSFQMSCARLSRGRLVELFRNAENIRTVPAITTPTLPPYLTKAVIVEMGMALLWHCVIRMETAGYRCVYLGYT